MHLRGALKNQSGQTEGKIGARASRRKEAGQRRRRVGSEGERRRTCSRGRGVPGFALRIGELCR